MYLYKLDFFWNNFIRKNNKRPWFINETKWKQMLIQPNCLSRS